MANITAAAVNELRQKTGVGMMDCKKALVECDGDMEKAIDYLREKGQKVASKRADRDASEGCVLALTNQDKTFGAIIMINCETDFVGKNEDFVNFTRKVLENAINAKAKNAGEVNQLVIDGSTVENLIVDQVAKIGEKIQISHYEALEAPVVYAYIHPGNRLASLHAMNKTGFDERGHDVAMQIAAMAPLALDKSQVSADVIEREMDVYRVQIREEGKPDNMIEKIAEGKLNKFFKESTLLSQEFIKDSKKNVLQYLQEGDKDLTVTAFYRLMLGA
ncbi:MAG: translation elongation factor Ts [Bacteroidales bacterium]|jgi:elongation factor Ts|nr:translation elongation factor Ts [Bacteroidales bacterium]MDD4702771.1 translation elongation factor Ts [Bacteroidales bacterium]MDX9798279.1 translation elongation factor Ts [Bacteroidales bacterium]